MKIFLNIIGILALLSGPLAFFAGGTVEARVLGGLALLVAVTGLGLAKVIEVAEDETKAAQAHRKAEVENWAVQHSIRAAASRPSTLSAPAVPRWFMAKGEEVTGPFTKSQLGELVSKGLAPSNALLAREGTEDWKPVTEVVS